MQTRRIPIPIEAYDGRDVFAIDPKASSDLLNVRTFQDFVQKTPGRQSLGTFAPGVPRNIFQADVGFETPQLGRIMLFTHDTLYLHEPIGNTNTPTGEVFTANTPLRFGIANALGIVAYSQGVDNLRQWDGTTFSDLVTVGQNHASRFIIGFANHLVSARPVYGGSEKLVEIRWSVNGNPNDWAGPGSGSLQVQETSMAPISGLFVLGDRAYIMKPFEVIELIATSALAPVFRTEVRVSGTGCKAGYSISTGDQRAFWVGPDNIYQFDGFTLQSIGDKVWNQIAAAVAESAQEIGIILPIQGQVYTSNSEYHILIPLIHKVYIYDYKRDRWYIDSTPDVTAIGLVSQSVQIAGYPRTSFVAYADYTVSSGRFMFANPTVYSYLGSPIDAYITTHAATNQQVKGGTLTPVVESFERVNEILVVRFTTLREYSTTVSISVDGGNTYVGAQTLAPLAGNGRVMRQAFFQVPFSGAFRVKFANNSTTDWAVDGNVEVGWEEVGVSLQV